MSAQSNEMAGAAGAAASSGEGISLPRRWTGGRRFWSIGLLAAGLIAALIAVWAVLSGGPSNAPVPAEITVVKIVNSVETDRPRGTGPIAAAFAPAVIGQDLQPGDGIRTFVNSEARVDIKIQDYVRVSRTIPNTLWRLGQFSLDEETIIELDEGKIFLFDGAPDPTGRPFKIVTPAGTASPRGTWMSFSYDPVSEVAELQCFRGSCQLENAFGSQVMRDEQKSNTTPSAAPAAPVDMTPDETRIFVELPEASTGELIIPTPVPAPEPTVEATPLSSGASQALDDSVGIRAGVGPASIDEANNAAPADDRSPGPEAAEAPQPTPVPTTVIAPTATPRPTPMPTARRVLKPTPIPAFTPKPSPALTPTPKPADILLPPVNASALPHVFVGSANIGLAKAPDGTEVSVWTSGYSEPLARALVSAGAFTVLVPQYGAEAFEGRILTFRLNGLAAIPEAVWSSGGADVLSLEASRN